MHPTDRLAAARKALEAAQREYDAALEEHQAAYPWLHGLPIEAGKTNYNLWSEGLPPEEWQAGDWVECVGHGLLGCTKGRIYSLVIAPGSASDDVVVDDDQGDKPRYPAHAFRFHSRP